MTVFELVMTEALFEVEPLVSVQQMKMKRLDLTRDHQVDDPVLFLTGLSSWPRSYLKPFLWYSGGRLETVAYRNGSGCLMLYDKESQSAGLAPGILRFEAQCRGPWLKKYGDIERVGDVTSERLRRVARQRKDLFGLERRVMSLQTAEAKIRSLDADPRFEASLIVHLRARQQGKEPPLSQPTIRDNDRFLADLGIAVSKSITDRSVRRLDWMSGKEIRLA